MRLIVWGFLLAASSVSAAAPLAYETEWKLYRSSVTQCTGKHAESAAAVGFKRYYEWKRAVDIGQVPPDGAFRDAGEAFEFLYREKGCRDGLVSYRYGNLLRHRKQYAESTAVISGALTSIRRHYPSYIVDALRVLGQSSVAAGQWKDAIAFYEEVLSIDPMDFDTRLNLANQLVHRARYEEAVRHLQSAAKAPLSNHGRGVLVKLARTISAECKEKTTREAAERLVADWRAPQD